MTTDQADDNSNARRSEVRRRQLRQYRNTDQTDDNSNARRGEAVTRSGCDGEGSVWHCRCFARSSRRKLLRLSAAAGACCEPAPLLSGSATRVAREVGERWRDRRALQPRVLRQWRRSTDQPVSFARSSTPKAAPAFRRRRRMCEPASRTARVRASQAQPALGICNTSCSRSWERWFDRRALQATALAPIS